MLHVKGYEYSVFEVINYSLTLANMFCHGRENGLLGMWLKQNAETLSTLQFSSWKECVEFVVSFTLPTEKKPFDYFC